MPCELEIARVFRRSVVLQKLDKFVNDWVVSVYVFVAIGHHDGIGVIRG